MRSGPSLRGLKRALFAWMLLVAFAATHAVPAFALIAPPEKSCCKRRGPCCCKHEPLRGPGLSAAEKCGRGCPLVLAASSPAPAAEISAVEGQPFVASMTAPAARLSAPYHRLHLAPSLFERPPPFLFAA